VQISAIGPIPDDEVKRILDGEGMICCATHENGQRIIDEPQAIADHLARLECKYTAYPHPSNVSLTSSDEVTAFAEWSTSGKLKTTYSHNAEIQELRFNPVNESQFAAVDTYGELRIWDTENTSPIKTVKVESISTGKLKCLAWSHDGKYISVGSVIGGTGMIYTFDTINWSKSGFDLPGLGGVNSLDYNRDSSRLAVGHDNGLIVCNTDTY